MFARAGLLAVAVLLVAGAVPAFSSTPPPGGSRLRDVSALPKDPVAYERAKARANARYAKWAKQHGIAAPTRDTSVSGGLNHSGLAYADANNLNGGTPPDTTGAIGPSNYVEMVNSEIGVYSSSDLTAPVTSGTLDQATFFGDPSAFTCDGQIQWDQEGQRWLYAGLNCNANFGQENLYVGFSKGTSPLPLDSSNWCRYQIPTGSNLEDYPKLGHDDSEIIIGTNEFANDGVSYDGSNVYVLPKPAAGAITTCPSQTNEVTNSLVTLAVPDAFTPVPANIADSSANGYVVATDGVSDTQLDLYTITPGITSSADFAPTTTVTVPSWSTPASVPQPGGSGDTLDSLDGRLTQAVAVKTGGTGPEEIWTQHTIDGGGPSVVRWYELNPSASTPTQTGTVTAAGGAFAFMGAISPSSDGENAAIFYNTGSSTQRADARVEDRHPDTPSGQMIEELQLAASPNVDNDLSCESWGGGPCRWGDYNGAGPDPSNSCLVWGTAELTVAPADVVNGTPQWGSQNAAIGVSESTCWGLTLKKTGPGSGTVSSNPEGVNCGGTCTHAFPDGTSVQLTASPDANSTFTGWSGDCTGSGVCNVTMSQAHAVTANFAGQPPQTLTVSKSGTGSGTVGSSPAGVSCGSTCSSSFDYGTPVQLTATPATGSTFAGWSGDCTGTGTCNVTMTAAHAVTATFTLQSEALTVSKTGSGTVASTIAGINCGSTCSHSYSYGTSVTLTATPATCSVFIGWSGACSGVASCTVPMTAATSVTATFGLAPELLTVTKSGSGKVTSSVAGISCGSACSHSYDYGTSVTLTAKASPGSKFAGWSGVCSGKGGCTVSMTAATSVKAKFVKLVCVVPKLTGKTLAAAKRALRVAHCGVGTVTQAASTRAAKGKVVSQKPKSGTHLRQGTPVSLVVGKG